MPAPDYLDEIAALESAIATGELEVQFADGRMVKYRSISDLKQAVAYFKGLKTQRRGTTLATFRRC